MSVKFKFKENESKEEESRKPWVAASASLSNIALSSKREGPPRPNNPKPSYFGRQGSIRSYHTFSDKQLMALIQRFRIIAGEDGVIDEDRLSRALGDGLSESMKPMMFSKVQLFLDSFCTSNSTCLDNYIVVVVTLFTLLPPNSWWEMTTRM